jgi:hypothetical protein
MAKQKGALLPTLSTEHKIAVCIVGAFGGHERSWPRN